MIIIKLNAKRAPDRAYFSYLETLLTYHLRSKPSVILVLKYINIFLGMRSSSNSMMVVLINFQMSKMHSNSFRALNVHFNKLIPGKSRLIFQS